MLKENVVVRFQGFSPSEHTQDYIQNLVEEIHVEAPNSSKLEATFIRKGKWIKGTMHIHSGSGPLFISAAGTQLNLVADKILHAVRRQINKWKTRNHERTSLKNLSLKQEFMNESFNPLPGT